MGTLWAVELVGNRDKRDAIRPSGRAGSFVSKFCREAGMILRANGDIIVLAPSLIMTNDQADEMVGLIDQAIAQAMEHCTLEGESYTWSE